MNEGLETGKYTMTHLRAANAVFPVLVPQNGEASLLRGDPLALLERLANGAGRNLGVLVEPMCHVVYDQ